MSVQTIHFLRPPPPQKKSTHQHFLSAKNPHENNKNQAKKLQLNRKNVDFHRHPPPFIKVYGLYTPENVDIYGRPLIKITFRLLFQIENLNKLIKFNIWS